MNKHYKYGLPLAIAVLLGATGCEKDFLDTRIDTNATPETIITDRATLFSFGNAFYTALPNGFYQLDGNLFAAASDEAQQTNAAAANVRFFNQGTLSPVNMPTDGSNPYKTFYDGIRAANFFLNYSTGYVEFLLRNRDTTNTSAIVNYRNDSMNIAWYRGEAHIARAFYYFELSKRWGGVPVIEQTFDQAADLHISRTGYDELVTYMVNEIDKYKDSLQPNWKTSSFKANDGRFSLASALALKTRILLYAASPLQNPSNDAAKWQKAAAAAQELMTAPGLNLALYTGGYRNYFTGSNPIVSANNETILAVRAPANNTPEVNNYPIGTPGGNSGIAPSHNLVAAYEYIGEVDPADPYKNRDPRLAASIVTNGSTWTGRTIDQSAGATDDMRQPNTSRTGYYLKKFLTDALNLQQGGTALHNWVLFRYAEVLLNYAEAMNEAYGPDANNGYALTARQALQLVRNRASTQLPAVTASTKETFREVLKHERRIELAFEDHRYWDLLRWKDAATVLNQPVKGVTVTKNPNGSFNYQVVDVASRAFRAPMELFPFAQSEIVNGNGKLIQNTGY
ncbi:MAG: RagB/SusD family nutrient uptake outer membrane protein [Candidatus Pseudobacter hemicellulosilyticus]|uniref:RagB/SusD family nutrient uptake outer membrane protein n=1 Tax=Candidatus Pseudobacter hemicellulosilyticus TaxID=3121375 RepID=A0AAJ5WWG8_9BACT|nr:MAG: RagB/SusD family nutrient uptake outer membrane protein [Pseudobacter sp.]